MAGRVDRGLFNLLLSGEMIIDDGEEMGGGMMTRKRGGGWMNTWGVGSNVCSDARDN